MEFPIKVRALMPGAERTQVCPPPSPKAVELGWSKNLAYQPALGFDEGPVDAIHLVVEATGIAQVVPRPIPPPEWGGHGSTVDTLSAF